MRSGIYDFTSDPAFNRAVDANPLMPFKPIDAIKIIRRHKPLFAPNARTQYADSTYVLLGIILKKVTGKSVESVITRDVMRPAGLRHTSFPTTAAMFLRDMPLSPDLHEFPEADSDQGSIAAAFQGGY